MNAFTRLRQRLTDPEEAGSRGFLLGQRFFVLLVIGCALLVFAVTYFARVSYSRSDPRPSLLVSQAMLKEHTIRLDAYMDSPILEQPGFTARAENGHDYYYWPLGPSVYSIPFVWLANLYGKDMAELAQNDWAQNLIAAILCSLVFVILYKVCRRFVSPWASLVIAAISVFGSALISTMGTALWNIDYAVLFISLALLQLSYLETGEPERTNPTLLGGLLFCAFFSRPSTLTFILVSLVFLLLRHRRVFAKTAAVALVLLFGFLAFSWLEYGKPFPDYFSVGRLQVDRDPLWVALYGHFLSPSRGILIFSPFFALVLVGILASFRDLRRDPLFWFGATWFGLHIVVVSRSTIWWGGYSYGPRILTEVIPALVLITALLWRIVSRKSSPRVQVAVVASYILLGLVAVFINSYQGLYNPTTQRWNGTGLDPDVAYSAYVLDWRYPQFSATYPSICDRNRELVSRALERGAFDLESYRLGDTITYVSGIDSIPSAPGRPVEVVSRVPDERLDPRQHLALLPAIFFSRENAIFVGWSEATGGYRWSECLEAGIVFELGDMDLGNQPTMLEISAGSLGAQRVSVYINGVGIGDLVFPGPATAPSKRTIAFDGALFDPNSLNEIKFHLPDARSPNRRDPRLLGLTLTDLRIYTTSEAEP